MRMDRYEDIEKENDTKQRRTSKNQELYTDVYLNNVYVDVSNLKEVVSQEEEEESSKIKVVRENQPVTYTYKEKNYDILSVLEEAMKNRTDDNLKRSLDGEVTNKELDSLIESINENQKQSEEPKKEDLLTDLMPSDENTTVIPPLEEPILDTSLLDASLLEENKMSQDMLDLDITEKDLEVDDSFVESKNNKIKIILFITAFLLLIGIILGILFYKNII